MAISRNWQVWSNLPSWACVISIGCFTPPIFAAELEFPRPGVVCDATAGYCADKQGPSLLLTQFYLGTAARRHLQAAFGNGERVNFQEFTFSNGVHCDASQRQCYKDRYYPRTPDKQENTLTGYLFGEAKP